MRALTSSLIRLLSRPFGSELCLFLSLSILSLVVCIFESITYSDDIVRETRTSTTDFSPISNSEDGVLEYTSLFEIKSVFVSSVLCLFSGIFLLNKLSFFIFFGKLSDTERIHLSRMFFKFVLLRFVILSGAINVSRLVSIFAWLVWFSSLMLLHSCALLTTSRCGQFSASSRISAREWSRISFALLFLVVGNWYLLIGGLTHRFILSEVNPLNQSEISKEALGRSYGSVWKTPTALGILTARISGRKAPFYGTIDVVAYITAESLLLFCRSARLISGVLLQAYDRWSLVNGRSWPQQGTVLYYVEFIHIMFFYVVEILHYLHLLLWSRIFSLASLIVFLHIRCTYSLLVDRIRRHLFHRRLLRFIKLNFHYCALDKSEGVKTLDSGDADCSSEHNTTASLRATPKDAGEVCAICWEPLITWRRLPCRHDFHENCLRSWLEQNPTCPTCRRDLGIPPTLQSNLNRNIQPNQLALGFLLRNFLRPRQREFNLPQAGRPTSGPMATSAAAPHLLGVRNRGLFAAAVGLNLGVSIGSDPIVTAAAQTVARETAPGRSVTGATFPAVSEVPGPSSSTLTPVNPAVQSQQLPRTDAAVPEDADQVRRRSFHFNGSRYFSWLPSLHVELSEVIREVFSTNIPNQPFSNVTETSNNEPQFTGFPMDHPGTEHPFDPEAHELIRLPRYLRGYAQELSAAFPHIPLADIVADLLQTRQPEVTADNLIQRPPPPAPPLAQQSSPATPSSLSPSVAPPETSRSVDEENASGYTVRHRTLDEGQRTFADLGSGNGDSYLHNRRREMLERARQRFVARHGCHS